ncbi:MAG: DUF5312 family protein [Treponema sp.]|nr:DUF5312 family protein [Treponema sp.]
MDIKADDKNKKEEKVGFFQSLFGGLFKSNNPDAEKKRRLKLIAKNFSKTKFHNYYKPSSGEVQAPFAKFFYELYKVTNSAQLLIKSTPNPNLFKRQVLNYSLSEHQVELLDHFEEEAILEASKKVPYSKLKTAVEADLAAFSNEFDNTRFAKTENLYKAFVLFKDFCTFDYYVLLRKFWPSIQENNFDSTPQFEKINADYIVNDLKDFVSIAYSITDESVIWNELFEMLKKTHGRDFVGLNNWKKIVARIRSIQASGAFEYMIQHISKDPKYETQTTYKYEALVEDYIEKIQNDTRKLLDKISHDQKADKSNSICMQIFGSTSFANLHNYVDENNAVLIKKELNTYEYTDALNYLKTFLLEYVKKDIREFYDIVVIRGQWDATLSAGMSNAYQELLKVSEEIITFDANLAEDGPMGSKIKTLLPKTAHDPGAENIINRVVSDANDMARNFIITCTQDFITIGKTLKQLIEDYVKPKPVIVANWRELEKFFETPLKDFSVNLYKKIYLFVQLMQEYINNNNN